jgi:hypothetical protein
VQVAVSATIPWDSYLIRTGIWSYPSHVVAGPTLLDIPLEEVFFFVIQTYNTTLLYLILSKPTFQPHGTYPLVVPKGRWTVVYCGRHCVGMAAGQGKWTGHVHWPHRGLGWTCPTGTMVGHAATT